MKMGRNSLSLSWIVLMATKHELRCRLVTSEREQTFSIFSQQEIHELQNGKALALKLELPQWMGMVDETVLSSADLPVYDEIASSR